jgi:hypothetical protein
MQDRKRVALLSRGLMDICYALAESAAMVSPVFLKLDAGFLDLQGCRLGLFRRHNDNDAFMFNSFLSPGVTVADRFSNFY